MIVNLTVPDEIFQAYLGHAKGSQNRALGIMGQYLAAFAGVKPGERCILIREDERVGFEKLLPFPTPLIKDGADLLERVKSIAELQLGGIRLDFTEGELRAIRHYADRASISAQEALEVTVEDIKKQVIDYLPESTANAAMTFDRETDDEVGFAGQANDGSAPPPEPEEEPLPEPPSLNAAAPQPQRMVPPPRPTAGGAPTPVRPAARAVNQPPPRAARGPVAKPRRVVAETQASEDYIAGRG